MNRLLKDLCRPEKILQEEIFLDRPFEKAAASFADSPGTVLLLSGSDLDCARYNILAADPWLELACFKNKIFIKCLGRKFEFEADPFHFLKSLVEFCSFSCGDEPGSLPVISGLFGYFAYDLKDSIEKLPRTCTGAPLPDMCLYAPLILIVQDRQRDGGSNRANLCIPELSGPGAKQSGMYANPDDIRKKFFDRLNTRPENKPFCIDNKGLKSCFTRHEYIEAVEKVIAYLKAGDIYQANLSQRFEAGFEGDVYSFFLDLFRRNPASFFSYINAGDHEIISTSPERFIKQSGRLVETRPIKGTIARGRTADQDRENRKKLGESIKDDAELTMIVDLMRNDLSRVTKPGSVIVREHKRLEAYENVFHLVSVVEGKLRTGMTSVDFLKACFPGGSITGCPKIRSMEIIDELEPVKRHIYTGSVGYISFHDTMDLSIAIRTATVFRGRIFFSVGGGIVYDSDPEKEYRETLDKGRTLMQSLAGGGSSEHGSAAIPVKAWVQGKIIDQENALVSASCPGFQYGAGVFETIRVENGRILSLEGHVSRMNRALKQIFKVCAPDITWEHVIKLLIRENQLQNKIAAVKILAAIQSFGRDMEIFVAAFARPYVHRLEMLGKTGLDLVTYPHPRMSPMADYKTLNYLYYDRAAGFARECGADEALILNPDSSVSETNTANIFAVNRSDMKVIVPESDHVLEGITMKSVLTILSDKGYDICPERIQKDEFCANANIILTNSLMGAVRVDSIDGVKVDHDRDICSMINGKLFGK